MTGLRTSDFVLERAIVEVRYSPAFLHFDRAGVLWSSLKRKWPGLELREGQPLQTAFWLRTPRREMIAAIQQARLIAFDPAANLESFDDAVSAFLDVVCSTLEIDAFERLGFRQVFFRKTDDAPTAASLVAGTGLLRIPPNPVFGVSGEVLGPEYVVRWEGEARGVRASVRAESRIIEASPPPDIPEIESYRKERYGVVSDIDVFTTQPVGVEQIHMKEWLPQARYAIQQDFQHLLDGWK